jgi:nucleoside-triphosphatase
MVRKAHKILVEGRPGVGKSTAAREVARLLQDHGVAVAGFVTNELRQRGRRVGFVVVALTGAEAVLAHVDLPGPPRVGRYGVDLAAFESVALPALQAATPGGVVILDELGKMELASATFASAVTRLFAGEAAIVATVHAFRHHLTDVLKRRADTDVVRLSPSNRDELPAEIVRRLLGD